MFAGAKGKDVEIATPAAKGRLDRQPTEAYKERLKPITDALEALQKPYAERVMAERLAELDPKAARGLAHSQDEKQRTPEEKTLAMNAMEQIEPTWDVVVAAMTPEDQEKRTQATHATA